MRKRLTLQIDLKVGDLARNIESGWLGRIESFERNQNDEMMVVMIGVDEVRAILLGKPMRECLDLDDKQWHSPDDLVLVLSQ